MAYIREKAQFVIGKLPFNFYCTKALLDEFAQSFNDADELIILDIYGSAREQQGGIHTKDLIKKVKSQKSKDIEIKYIPTLQECEKYLKENIVKGDIVILMGAGDVFRIGENLIKS
jgi:UDP-N-acetylmuramate--alanine ligase